MVCKGMRSFESGEINLTANVMFDGKPMELLEDRGDVHWHWSCGPFAANRGA